MENECKMTVDEWKDGWLDGWLNGYIHFTDHTVACRQIPSYVRSNGT